MIIKDEILITTGALPGAGETRARARSVAIAVCIVAGLGLWSAASAQQQPARAGLAHDAQTRSPVPIPPSEQALQTAVAESWFKLPDEGRILEGSIFDRDGNLLFCDVTGRRVLRLTQDKRLSTIVTLGTLAPGGLAVSRDGRIFIAALDIPHGRGAIFAVNPDGSGLQPIIPEVAGYMPNDLVFDAHGGFYFTDFKGTATEPKGGLYYVTPDFSTIQPVLSNLALANGVALSPDGKALWITEFGRNLLHRILLSGPATIAPIRSVIAYHFTGPAPDSMRADADGNVYVAISGQGRALAFNRNGLPIGQVLIPGRDDGRNLSTTSLAIRPGTHDLYIVTSDGAGGQSATVFHSTAFGNGLPAVPSP